VSAPGRNLTHAEVVERLATLIRDEAFPEFGSAPPPEWASRAAEKIIALHQPMLRDDLLRQAIAAERARLTAAVETMPTARVISQWDLVSRKAILTIVNPSEAE
jgi:hypothetical protein